MSAEHDLYCEHVRVCEAAERGSWCQACRDLLWDADAADWALVSPTTATASRTQKRAGRD